MNWNPVEEQYQIPFKAKILTYTSFLINAIHPAW